VTKDLGAAEQCRFVPFISGSYVYGTAARRRALLLASDDEQSTQEERDANFVESLRALSFGHSMSLLRCARPCFSAQAAVLCGLLQRNCSPPLSPCCPVNGAPARMLVN
jgi:hypothetical protein